MPFGQLKSFFKILIKVQYKAIPVGRACVQRVLSFSSFSFMASSFRAQNNSTILASSTSGHFLSLFLTLAVGFSVRKVTSMIPFFQEKERPCVHAPGIPPSSACPWHPAAVAGVMTWQCTKTGRLNCWHFNILVIESVCWNFNILKDRRQPCRKDLRHLPFWSTESAVISEG